MLRVYIASPYTKGDIAANVKTQLDVANALMDRGYAPFAPLLCHFQHIAHPRPYQDWLACDLEWILHCNMVLRLPGESAGADEEVALAKEHGIPVYYSLGDLP